MLPNRLNNNTNTRTDARYFEVMRERIGSRIAL